MNKAMVDWAVVGLVIVFIIVLISFVQARSGVITGKLIDASIFSSRACQTMEGYSPFSLSSRALELCANKTHEVSFFSIQSNETTIVCNGSTLQGKGGALFVPRGVQNPRVTLSNCTLSGFDGLYQAQNPVQVRME